MLHTTEFQPAVGCTALLDGEQVRIHQRIDARTVLVLGDRITRRVDVADLRPAHEPTLFERWLAARTWAGSDHLVTPASVLMDDYRDWLERHDAAAAWPVNPNRFAIHMREAGHTSFIATWREPGDTQTRARRVYALLLKGRGQ
jgi:hypothetical protein